MLPPLDGDRLLIPNFGSKDDILRNMASCPGYELEQALLSSVALLSLGFRGRISPWNHRPRLGYLDLETDWMPFPQPDRFTDCLLGETICTTNSTYHPYTLERFSGVAQWAKETCPYYLSDKELTSHVRSLLDTIKVYVDVAPVYIALILSPMYKRATGTELAYRWELKRIFDRFLGPNQIHALLAGIDMVTQLESSFSRIVDWRIAPTLRRLDRLLVPKHSEKSFKPEDLMDEWLREPFRQEFLMFGDRF
jgi:hypothetical protein